MKLNIIITMLLVMSGMFVKGQDGKAELNKAGLYEAMASESVEKIDAELESVVKSAGEHKEAFEGVLLMRKAGLVSGAGKKLKLFKSGHKKLENSIAKESKNAELRFLRLMIQENAPGILNYSKEINEDSQLIRAEYKSLPQVVQRAVVDYSKKSKVLKPEFFN